MANYKYTAFISYRHLEPDSIVAENLHRLLETYTLPKNLQKTLGRKKIGKIFRDKEELPITDSLDDQLLGALNQSEYLIVICSPRLQESEWCKREIETFIKIRGKKNVLLVLADGEPDVSFPPIIYDKTTEPLAADARGTTSKERIKKLKTERLRLLAPILGVEFDDLKQRERERKIKSRMNAISVAAAIAFTFAALAITSAVRIKKQADLLAYDKAIQMAGESQRLLDDDKRLESLQIAYEALTSSDSVDMPYTPEAQYALVDALRVYDSAKYSKAVLEINATDTICAVDFNSNPFEVIYADKSGNVAVWLYEEYDKIYETFDGLKDPQSEHTVGFIDKNIFYYINEFGQVVISSIDNTTSAILSDAEFTSAYLNDDHSVLAALSDDSLYVYDLKDNSILYNDFVDSNSYIFADCIGWDSTNGLILYSVCDSEAVERETLKVADINKNELLVDALFTVSQMKDCICENGVFYVLSERREGDLGKLYVCALDAMNNTAKWNSNFNGVAGELYFTSKNSLAVTAGNDLYIYNHNDGTLIGNYSFNSDVGCLTESDGNLYIRNLNGDSSVIDSSTGAYLYLGKLIDCTNLSKLKSLEITEYNYAYMGIAANGNDNHLIFYNYMVNDIASIYNAEVLVAEYRAAFGSDAITKAEALGADIRNTVYSIVTDNDNLDIITYKNGTVDIYDEKTKKLLYHKSVGLLIDKYMGEDIYGNKYFGSENSAIMVSSNNEIVASIEDMIGLTSDRTGILMNSFDENRYPIVLKYDVYSKDDLLEMAEYKMDYYNFDYYGSKSK